MPHSHGKLNSPSHYLGSLLSGKYSDKWAWVALLPVPSFVSALYLQPLLTERFAMLHAVVHTQVGLAAAITTAVTSSI